MGIKSKLAGLGAALALGLTLVAPAGATGPTQIGTAPVSVTISSVIQVPQVSINTSSTGLNFGSQAIDAVGTTGGSTTLTGGVFVLQITNDSGNFNSNDPNPQGFDIQIRLTGGNGTNPALVPTSQPVFQDSTGANFQIPGRYLKITDVGNPIQAKYTGGSSCSHVWDGTVGCAPRDADNSMPIYRVGDPVGLMGLPEYDGGTCRVVSGTSAPWGGSCGNNTFSDPSAKLIMHFRPGSGTVGTQQTLNMSLTIPAGVYPTTYTGTLVVEQVAPLSPVSTP